MFILQRCMYVCLFVRVCTYEYVCTVVHNIKRACMYCTVQTRTCSIDKITLLLYNLADLHNETGDNGE